MKVLLVSLNRLSGPIPILPMGAAMVCRAVMQTHEARFLDLMFQKEPERALMGELRRFSPDVICLSIRNLDNQTMQAPESYLDAARRIAALCRQASSARLVLGGAAMQVMGPELLEELGADRGIIGPGECEVLPLLETLDDPAAPSLRTAGPDYSPRFSCLPPARMFEPAYFASNRRRIKYSIGYQTIRGCSAGCIYCSHAHTPRAMVPPELLEDDFKRLAAEYQPEGVTFTDDIFNQDETQVAEICETILRSGVRVPWTCSMHPGVCSGAMLALMKRAGCAFVDLGVDSACGEMLERLGKGFRVDQLLELGELLQHHEIPYSVSLLFGGPGESERTVLKTVDTLKRLHPVFILAGMGIRVYPRTALCRIAREEGAEWTDRELLSPRFYCSPGFSEELLRGAVSESGQRYKTMCAQALPGADRTGKMQPGSPAGEECS